MSSNTDTRTAEKLEFVAEMTNKSTGAVDAKINRSLAQKLAEVPDTVDYEKMRAGLVNDLFRDVVASVGDDVLEDRAEDLRTNADVPSGSYGAYLERQNAVGPADTNSDSDVAPGGYDAWSKRGGSSSDTALDKWKESQTESKRVSGKTSLGEDDKNESE